MPYTLPADCEVAVQVAYTDANGNPATVNGYVAWESSNEDVVHVQVDGKDSTMATVTARGKIGAAQVSAVAPDLGEGTRSLVTTMDVNVVAGEAVAGTISPVSAAKPIAPQPIL